MQFRLSVEAACRRAPSVSGICRLCEGVQDGGHRRDYLGQRAAPGARQRLLENFPMLLFGAVMVPGGALLEFPHHGRADQGIRKIDAGWNTSPSTVGEANGSLPDAVVLNAYPELPLL